MSEGQRTRPLYALLALLLGTGVALACAEIGLRAFSSDLYHVWPPNLERTFPALPEITPGIEGETTFSTNAWGIRGRPFSEDDDLRILAFGGSTTECVLLDDTEAWPHLLEAELERTFAGAGVWVGNVAKSGHSSRDHVLQVEELPPQYPRIDVALVLVGVNDLALRLRRDTAFVPFAEAPPEYHEGLLTHAFVSVPDVERFDYPFYKRTALWQTVRRALRRWEEPPPGEDQGRGAGYLIGARERRQRAGRLDSLPDLSTALEDYARTLGLIVTRLEAQDIEPVLITQPYLWREDLPRELEALLWFGRAGRSEGEEDVLFYTSGAMAEAMRRYNDTLRRVCRERGLACIDLAPALPPDTTVFYDDVHFNEGGARSVAALIADALAQNPEVRARLTP